MGTRELGVGVVVASPPRPGDTGCTGRGRSPPTSGWRRSRRRREPSWHSAILDLGNWIADDAAVAAWGPLVDEVDLNDPNAIDRIQNLPSDAEVGKRVTAHFDAGGVVDAVVEEREGGVLGTRLVGKSRYSTPADVNWGWGVALRRARAVPAAGRPGVDLRGGGRSGEGGEAPGRGPGARLVAGRRGSAVGHAGRRVRSPRPARLALAGGRREAPGSGPRPTEELIDWP